MQTDIENERKMISTLRAKGVCRPWLPLLSQILALAGPRAEFESHSEKPWSSVTFTGTRHRIFLSFSGADAVEAGEAFITALPDHEFTVARQLVADATVSSAEHIIQPEPKLTVEAELLLIEDG